jgi:hypothetical protein
MTIRYWARQDWWQEELLRCDSQDSTELKSTFTKIAKKATELLEDRLEHGDEVITKDGEIVKRQIPGRELAIIAGVAADKRRMEMDQPNRVSVQSSTEKLAQLMEEFMKFAKAKPIKGEVIDVQESSSTPSEPV